MHAITSPSRTFQRVPWHSEAAQALSHHWPEYCIEAAALGTFMLSACLFSVLLDHPDSPAYLFLSGSALLRRSLAGLAMALTAIAIFCSPWGKRSGAHMNPSVTLAFLSLRKIAPWDAFFYSVFQFTGGIAGVAFAGLLIGAPLQHSAVNYAVTVPGPAGPTLAFAAEFLISTLMMSMVLCVSNSPRFSRYTPFFAASLIATFITLEAPFSGMSMNPARTLASAVNAHQWTSLWIYFVAPTSAMLFAAALYRYRRGVHAVFCAKLHHCNNQRCIFHCRYGDLNAQ